MKQFEVVDISGDAGIKAFGASLPELFMNAAIGMYGLMINLAEIEETKTIYISVGSSSVEGLLTSWLNELVFHFDTYGFVGKRIEITAFSPDEPRSDGETNYTIRASLSGEDFDPKRHEGRLLVKAATYHNLRVEKKGGTWETEVVFDI